MFQKLFNKQSNNGGKKVAVGLSGGVDSAVTAHLLKEAGYNVTGVYMHCWSEKADGCDASEDRADAAKVASKLKIKFKTLDFEKQYNAKVIDYFYDEYKAGRTPNPDVMCNKEIKFGLFYDWAIKGGFDYVSTGHYARVEDGKLFRGIDDSKDQSYFLYLLTGQILKNVLFPLGEITKKEVRKIAQKVGFHNADKPDSVGICFVGEVDIREFLEERIKPKKGEVVNKKGEVIGSHDGVWFYTIGQRHGFNVTKYHGLPLYVIDKDADANKLVVGHAEEGKVKVFKVENLHWINETPNLPLNCGVRIRHLGKLYPAQLKDREVKLEYPIFGVAPGQSAVFYKDEETLGGGIITHS